MFGVKMRERPLDVACPLYPPTQKVWIYNEGSLTNPCFVCNGCEQCSDSKVCIACFSRAEAICKKQLEDELKDNPLYF